MDIPGSFNTEYERYKTISSGASSKSELMKLAAITRDDPEKGLDVAAREFTGMFIGQMLKEMRSTVQLCDLGHGGAAEETFQSMLDGEWAKNIAYNGDVETGGNGIVGVVYDSLQHRAVTKAYNDAVKACQ